MAFTADQLAKLEAQRAYFASDELIKDRAAIWRDTSPEECLVAVIDSCNEAAHFLSLKSAEELERVLAPEPLPPDTIAILEALQRRR
ncbi:MAG: hypothetical protein IPQ07_19875 [Myxococcales bacterium]|nr:hypothetical protein [Myxococcales bacterium]